MARTTAMEFQRQIGRYQDLALQEPVEITKHGRSRLVLLSIEEYKRLKLRDRRVYRAGDLPDEWLAAVAKASVSRKHRKLDRLLDEE